MEIISDYSIYLSKVEKGETQCIFSGEMSVLKVFAKEGANLPVEPFYVWDDLNCERRTVLLKVIYNGKSLCIVEGHCLEKSLKDIALSFGIGNLDDANQWWNLCYYSDERGIVHYDTYYDRYYAAGETEKYMSEIQEEFRKFTNFPFLESEGLIYLLGDLATCKPIVYLLQQRGLEVKTIQWDNTKNTSDIERMELLRKRLAVPYACGNQVFMGFFTSESISYSLALCQHPYMVNIPIDMVDINDKAIGECIYKDILPNGEFSHDYSCCGHNYCYLEIELLADLHGNTVLKATDSREKSRFAIINRFEYLNSNMHEYGETI